MLTNQTRNFSPTIHQDSDLMEMGAETYIRRHLYQSAALSQPTASQYRTSDETSPCPNLSKRLVTTTTDAACVSYQKRFSAFIRLRFGVGREALC
jgi:hypothetical protein